MRGQSRGAFAKGAMIGTIVGERYLSGATNMINQVTINSSHAYQSTFSPSDNCDNRCISAIQQSIAQSIIDSKGFDLEDQMQRLKIFLDVDGGITLPLSLRLALENAREHNIVLAGTQEDDLSDGSHLTRAIPIAIAYRDSSFKELMMISMLNAAMTHARNTCMDCFKYVALFTRMAVTHKQDIPIQKALLLSRQQIDYISHAWETQVVQLVCGGYHLLEADDLRKSCNHLSCLERVLWCLYKSHSFESAFEQLASTHDIPKYAYILLGSMAGAWYGIRNIPEAMCHEAYEEQPETEGIAFKLLRAIQ